MSSVYSASKFAMEGFSDGLRRELNAFGISVSIIEPGYVKSSIFATSAEESTVTGEKSELVEHFYSKHYDAVAQEKRQKTLLLADEPTVTSSAIFDAIASKYPKTRYPVANAGGIPAVVVDWIRWFLPARVMDRMLN
jgi:short-subunit dehydrogenase